MHAVVDVGAATGGFGLEVARRNPGLLVLCVEPDPALAAAVRRTADVEGLRGVRVVEVALGAAPSATQDLAGGTRGTPHPPAVEVVTLAALLDEQGADVVDFLRLGGREAPLDVLAGGGDRLPHVRAGMLVAPTVARQAPGEDAPPDLVEAVVRLRALGFVVEHATPHDAATAELDVVFARGAGTLAAVEGERHLRGVPPYDGSRYWAVPCASAASVDAVGTRLQDADRVVVAARTEVGRELAARRAAVRERDAARDEAVRLVAVLEQLGGEVATLADELADERGRVEQLEAELARTRVALHEVMASSSWRWTSPVRRLGGLRHGRAGR
ncbi:hypothetical protein [Cellulomonas marina]|uniref:Methyltransferase, FkbM family n=1 Tax=Cellulomonas marina TaxID=988821 RepID=A0A1I0V0X3_9CELL|nr:hypothetical protein [Cellulomonas marina]SFA69186.1 methyltransferase, FkbM family [Cellulomonas marina]